MTNAQPGVNWTRELVDQLDWHWQHQLRPRLEGLTDEEYFWEPVPGCWSLRPRAEGSTPQAAAVARCCSTTPIRSRTRRR